MHTLSLSPDLIGRAGVLTRTAHRGEMAGLGGGGSLSGGRGAARRNGDSKDRRFAWRLAWQREAELTLRRNPTCLADLVREYVHAPAMIHQLVDSVPRTTD